MADPSGELLHLVWEDNRNGSNQVYYKGSTDNGLTWGPDIKLSNLSPHTIDPLPRVASNGKQLLVFFSGGTGTGEHLYYAASMDSGSTFTVQNQLTNDRGYQTNAAVAMDGSTVHLVWQNYLQSEEHIYYMKSLDAGDTWLPEIALTAAAGQDRHPAIVAASQNVFVVWSRYDEGSEAVFFRASHDGAATWQPEVQLSGYEPPIFPIFPSIASNGTHVHVAWNGRQVLYARSANGGLDWAPPLPITNQTRQYLAPRISTSGSQVQVVTAAISPDNQGIGISSDVYYLESPGGGNEWNEPISLTAHYPDQLSLAPAIAVRGDATFVAWQDNRNGNFAIFVRSKPDFAEVKAFVNQLVTVVLIVFAATTASYLLLEIKHRSKRLFRAKQRARRRKRLLARTKGKRRKFR